MYIYIYTCIYIIYTCIYIIYTCICIYIYHIITVYCIYWYVDIGSWCKSGDLFIELSLACLHFCDLLSQVLDFLFVLRQLCYCAFVSKEIYRTFAASMLYLRKVKSSTTGSPRSPSAGSAGEGSASAGSATSPVLSSCNPNPNSNPNFHVKSPNLSGSAGVGVTGVAATTSKSIWMNLNSPCKSCIS